VGGFLALFSAFLDARGANEGFPAVEKLAAGILEHDARDGALATALRCRATGFEACRACCGEACRGRGGAYP
jgi:hypothetical protein